MALIRLAEINKMNLGSHQGVHNLGIKGKGILKRVGHELKENPPAVLAKTRRKSGVKRAEAQRKAILLSKARERGAKIPKK